MKIHETMLLNEILEMDPNITEIFLSHGLFCESCPGAHMESLKEAADGHGIDLKKLMEDLNNYLNKKE